MFPFFRFLGTPGCRNLSSLRKAWLCRSYGRGRGSPKSAITYWCLWCLMANPCTFHSSCRRSHSCGSWCGLGSAELRRPERVLWNMEMLWNLFLHWNVILPGQRPMWSMMLCKWVVITIFPAKAQIELQTYNLGEILNKNRLLFFYITLTSLTRPSAFLFGK